MSYNFLDLTNETLRRVNEVLLTDSNFANARNVQGMCKDAVNAAIRDINQVHYEWPFNHSSREETLSIGVTRYSFPDDYAFVDLDTFRIKGSNALGVSTTKLRLITYDEYLEKWASQEFDDGDGNEGVPQYVFMTNDGGYGVTPAPDKAYEIVYDYYRNPVDLDLYDDVPAIPERYRSVIIDGALHHFYMFRGNEQSATIAKSRFDEGIKRMRIMLMNPQAQYMRSGMITRSGYNISGPRVG